jgi:hypothetical protein
MKMMIFGAIALALAVPAAAQQAEHKMDCCEKMKAEGKECCCKDMAKKDHGEHGDKHAPEGDAAHQAHGEPAQ